MVPRAARDHPGAPLCLHTSVQPEPSCVSVRKRSGRVRPLGTPVCKHPCAGCGPVGTTIVDSVPEQGSGGGPNRVRVANARVLAAARWLRHRPGSCRLAGCSSAFGRPGFLQETGVPKGRTMAGFGSALGPENPIVLTVAANAPRTSAVWSTTSLFGPCTRAPDYTSHPRECATRSPVACFALRAPVRCAQLVLGFGAKRLQPPLRLSRLEGRRPPFGFGRSQAACDPLRSTVGPAQARSC